MRGLESGSARLLGGGRRKARAQYSSVLLEGMRGRRDVSLVRLPQFLGSVLAEPFPRPGRSLRAPARASGGQDWAPEGGPAEGLVLRAASTTAPSRATGREPRQKLSEVSLLRSAGKGAHSSRPASRICAS